MKICSILIQETLQGTYSNLTNKMKTDTLPSLHLIHWWHQYLKKCSSITEAASNCIHPSYVRNEEVFHIHTLPPPAYCHKFSIVMKTLYPSTILHMHLTFTPIWKRTETLILRMSNRCSRCLFFWMYQLTSWTCIPRKHRSQNLITATLTKVSKACTRNLQFCIEIEPTGRQTSLHTNKFEVGPNMQISIKTHFPHCGGWVD